MQRIAAMLKNTMKQKKNHIEESIADFLNNMKIIWLNKNILAYMTE